MTDRFLEPQTDCGSCLRALDGLDWVAFTTLRVGAWALGVRSSDVETDAALRKVLLAHVVDVDAPANFSMLMADNETRTFDLLYQANDILVRTRAHGRVLRTLLSHLSRFAEPTAPSIRLDAIALIVNGHAIVVPDDLWDHIRQIETRLNVAGIALADAPELHLGARAVIVPEPALSVDLDALNAYERGCPVPDRELPAVRPGRYPIAACVVVAGRGEHGPVSAAQGVAAASQRVANAGELGAAETLQAVATALAGVPVVGIQWFEPAGLFSQLLAVAEQSAGTSERRSASARSDPADFPVEE